MRRMQPGTCLVGLVAFAMAPVPARAQTVDYGALEQVFAEPVTTSATGKPQRVSDVPADMVVITADQIRRSGADNLPDILRFVPGLDVRRYGFAAAGVAVRGYSDAFSPRLLVLVNGQQVYLDDYGRTQWYALPVQLDEIRQIEIVKGPNTALFGFNAAAGVVNIVTYDPLYDHKESITARVGTQDYGALSGVGTVHLGDRGGIRASAGGFRADEFRSDIPVNQGSASVATPRNGTIALDGRFRIAPNVEAWASGSVVNLDTNEVASSGIAAPSDYRTNGARVGATADTRIGVLTLDAYRNQSRYSYLAPTGEGNLSDVLYVVRLSDTVRVANTSTVRAGLEYRHSSATSSADFAGQVGYQVASGSLMWNWEVTPRVSLTNAVRVDYFALSQSGGLPYGSPYDAADFNRRSIIEPSFNSGLVMRVTDRDTVRLTASRGLQLPSLFQFGFESRQVLRQGPPVSFLGSPRLEASAVSNVELDYDRSLPALRSVLRLSAFSQRTDNLLAGPFSTSPSVGPAGIVVRAANIGYSLAAGGEIGLTGEVNVGQGRVRWDSGYAYVRIADHETAAASAIDKYSSGTPAHVVIVGGGYSLGRFEADLHARWQSSYRDYRSSLASVVPQVVDISNYVEIQARLGYHVTRNLMVALSAEQLASNSLVETVGPPVERRVFVSATMAF